MESIKILYPYNEILPKKTAHDIYVFHNCLSLAKKGFSIQLLCGKGSYADLELGCYFGAQEVEPLKIQRLPILRKNNFLNLTWNPYFFFFCQNRIKKNLPHFVICSVIKQAGYHFFRKLPGIKYIYEVHQLCYYPNQQLDKHKVNVEKEILNKADLIVTTTESLKHILQKPPYSLKVPINVIPLAVHAHSLPMPIKEPLTIFYVGQLYSGQGISQLLHALSLTTNVNLEIVGGKKEEVAYFENIASQLGIKNRVHFWGFCSPNTLTSIIQKAHAFVAPFENQGRMPYVAHTKLMEYAEWGRPILAPDLPVVKEHFQKGTLLFKPNDPFSLADCIEKLKNRDLLQKLHQEIQDYSGHFSWSQRAEKYAELLTYLTSSSKRHERKILHAQ